MPFKNLYRLVPSGVDPVEPGVTALPYESWTRNARGKEEDPVNLVFRNISALTDVESEMTGLGWNRTRGWTQFLTIGGRLRKMDVQLSLGDPGNFITERFHVRLWHINGEALGSVHFEIFYLYTHKVHHFEGAERNVADQFASTRRWDCKRNQYFLDNYEYKRYNDGYATELCKK